MKLIIIVMSVCFIALCQFETSLANNEIDEILMEMLEDQIDAEENFEQRGYKAEKHAPARLRGCIHCVGDQRKMGKNVREATKHCNNICKREVFGDEDDEELEERRYKAEKQAPARLRGCIHCVGDQRKMGKNVREATKYCNNICKRDIFDDEEGQELEERRYKAEKQAPARLRGCIHCVGDQRKLGKNVREATKYCNNICKREVFDDEYDEELEERDLKRSDRLLDCYSCFGEKRTQNKSIRESYYLCNCAMSRG